MIYGFKKQSKNQKTQAAYQCPGSYSSWTFYTDEAVAALLKCNLKVMQSKFRDGEIVGYKKFGKWYTSHSNLLNFLTF